MDHDWTPINTLDELIAVVGTPSAQVAQKIRPALVDLDVAWLTATPFCMLATADAEGNCDASPKGDPAGELVHVIDRHTIALAERPGNRLVEGYKNVLANPHVGLNFFLPGRGDTLRINGRAELVSNAPFFDALAVRGKRPILALVVHIDEVFHHCAKAFLRSGLWDPSTWAPEAAVPRRAVVAKLIGHNPKSQEELDEYYGPAYADHLY